ncbi:hypothetical protein [Opitutus terrae]|uniref:Uncharacterized protein n=1 Tax=Opitutus terrae (strain DSM 11246 / JCM 15787 / PB90-1) TaxID=452637 RepID=B1ZUA7_OPITP|nr:hypothetical protein [Opitutus terrae]ACB76669.1 hypothetical protein Oter_3392 [Opitutus terrae PB90-1]
MKATQLQLVRTQATQVIHELGMLIHHCEEANKATRDRRDVAEEMADAAETAGWMRVQATRLEKFVTDINDAAQQANMPQKGGS